MSITIKLPSVLAVNETINGNSIQQVLIPACTLEASIANYTFSNIKGKVLVPTDSSGEKILVVEKKNQLSNSFSKIIFLNQKQLAEPAENYDLSTCTWLKHKEIKDSGIVDSNIVTAVNDSWKNCFSYLIGSLEKNIKGLREPQAGAVHAVQSHWSVTNETATIVMPTGTGKTETMISVMVSVRCRKILVIVPTDALRTQISEKFLTLGVLKDCRAISAPARYPVVGVLYHQPKSIEEVDNFFEKCNVIISTSQIAAKAPRNIQKRMAYHCSELFIDEAHHVQAPTWKRLKSEFQSCRTLQFTATPFRDDDEPLDGEIIYKYPLQKAQEEGYFKKINFKPVRVFNKKKHDAAIAEVAVEQLREDLKNYNHILMARVNSIPRAKEVFAVYEKYREFNPVQIHTELSTKEIKEAKRKIDSGESKIVVCVEMLGEGFDKPELKIAAFHDIRKSLPVTIQLAGRFTRQRADLGDATFIANIGRTDVRDKLKALYNQDTDWNFLLRHLTEEQIQDQIDLNKYAEGFRDFPKEIPIQSLNPALSTVIYKTKCSNWTPDNFSKGILNLAASDKHFHSVYPEKNVLIIVTQNKQSVEWTQVKEVFTWDWNLYVLFWDKEQKLLFINSSSNKGEFKRLAKAVAGDDVELIKGDDLFRCFSNITRLTFKNVGLSEEIRKLLSYTGNMGSNVGAVLTEMQTRRARKSVMFGTGFEGGKKTSIGCSRKGRVWSHDRSLHINRQIAWFSHVGRKISDESIDPDTFLKNTLVSTVISKRPEIMPFGIDWHEDVYKSSEYSLTFIIDENTEIPLYEVDIKLINPTETGDIEFGIFSENTISTFALKVNQKSYEIVDDNNLKVHVKWHSQIISAAEFFKDHPPSIWFVDGATLRGNELVQPLKDFPPFNREKIEVWNWEGVTRKKESQGIERFSDSVQFRVVEELKKGNYDLIFDDDDALESADIVTARIKQTSTGENIIDVEFYHCKFSLEEFAGARIKDLYEVCGQAQKSIHWIEKPSALFTHLLEREETRMDKSKVSRIQVGSADKIDELRNMASYYRMMLKIFIVQPGLSKQKASSSQLHVLGATQNYLSETYLIPFGVIADK